MTEKDNEQIMFLFTQVMTELRDIKKEITATNRCLTITTERQASSILKVDEMKVEMSEIKKMQDNCPARASHMSKKQIIKELTGYLALVLSIVAVYRIFTT